MELRVINTSGPEEYPFLPYPKNMKPPKEGEKVKIAALELVLLAPSGFNTCESKSDSFNYKTLEVALEFQQSINTITILPKREEGKDILQKRHWGNNNNKNQISQQSKKTRKTATKFNKNHFRR